MKAFSVVLFWFALALPPSAALAGGTTQTTAKAAEMEYLRGMLLERRGAYGEALEAYEKALALDPHSGFVLREAADLALEMGAGDKALRLALQAVAIEPKDAAARVLLGKVQWAKGDTAAAEASFTEALRLEPHSAESIFSLASLLSSREPAKARELLGSFLRDNPSQAAEAHFQLAKMDLQSGHAASAREHLKSAIDLDPGSESLPSRYALAQTYELERSTEEALAQYVEIGRLEPQNSALLDHMAQLYSVMGREDEARAKFEAAKAAEFDDPVANAWLSQEAERRGDYSRAAEYLKSSAALGEEPAVSLRLSFDLIQAGRLKEAVAALESARARWPNNDQVAYFLALGYDDLKDGSQAVKLMRGVVALKPDWRDARYELAVLFEKYGDMPASEREFRLLLSDRPDDASALNYLGYSLADRGLKLAEAEEMIRRAVALDANNGAYLDSLGWVHFKQGKSTEAVQELLTALAVASQDDEVWAHLGEAYAAAGDRPSAWRAWRRAASLNSANERPRKKAAQLEKEFSPEELGGYYLDSLASTQGGVRKLSGLCEIKGDILRHPFVFSGVFTFRAPDDLEVDLLGPVFTPLFRIRLNAQGFAMDPFRLDGVSPEAVTGSASAAFSAVRDFLSGRLFKLRPARYERGWRVRQISAPGWKIALSPDGLWAVSLSSEFGMRTFLSLQDLSLTQGRWIPRTFKLAGEGYSLSVCFDKVNLEVENPGEIRVHGEPRP